MSDAPWHIPLAGMPWEEPIEGMRQKRAEVGGKRVRLLEVTDAFVEPDWCIGAHAGLVVDGQCHIDFEDGTSLRFAAGDALVLPAKTPHKARVEKGATVRLLLVEDL